MSDTTPSPPTPPRTSGVERRPRSRTEARRREEQRRIDRQHRRARRLRIGWDWSPPGSRPGEPGRTPRRRRRTSVLDVVGVVAVGAASAWLLHLQGVDPTGDATRDLVVTSAVAVVVAVVGAVVDRRVLVVWGVVAIVVTSGRRFLSGVTFNALAGSGWQLLAGLAAIGLASGVALIDRRGRVVLAPVLGAASASLALQCLASVPQRNWPTVGAILAVGTVLGILYALTLRIRPSWLFD